MNPTRKLPLRLSQKWRSGNAVPQMRSDSLRCRLLASWRARNFLAVAAPSAVTGKA
jgi:hypothetical protein